jgi:hypothetical protein
LEGLAIEDVAIFMAILSILRPNGTIYDHLVYFSCFGMLYQEKSGNPDYDHYFGTFFILCFCSNFCPRVLDIFSAS